MQLIQIPTPIAQIKIPVAKTMEIGTITVHGASQFANLFSGALTLKVGDGSIVAKGKQITRGEVMSRFYYS